MVRHGCYCGCFLLLLALLPSSGLCFNLLSTRLHSFSTYVDNTSMGDILSAASRPASRPLPPPPQTLSTLSSVSPLSGPLPFSAFTPLERVCLTANGNLQRIFSSLYDRRVDVVVDYCNELPAPLPSSPKNAADFEAGHWDRQVHLILRDLPSLPGSNGSTFPSSSSSSSSPSSSSSSSSSSTTTTSSSFAFCRARSKVVVHSKDCLDLVRRGSIGIGQLFRQRAVLPSFDLIDYGRRGGGEIDGATGRKKSPRPDSIEDGDGGLWRLYELQTKELTCLIREDFAVDALNIPALAKRIE